MLTAAKPVANNKRTNATILVIESTKDATICDESDEIPRLPIPDPVPRATRR